MKRDASSKLYILTAVNVHEVFNNNSNNALRGGHVTSNQNWLTIEVPYNGKITEIKKGN